LYLIQIKAWLLLLNNINLIITLLLHQPIMCQDLLKVVMVVLLLVLGRSGTMALELLVLVK
jgi:hypothetical protein